MQALSELLEDQPDCRGITSTIATYDAVLVEFDPLLTGHDDVRALVFAASAELASAATAPQVSYLLYGFPFLDIIDAAAAVGRRPIEVAKAAFTLAERLEIDALLAAAAKLPRSDRWQTIARQSVRDDVFSVLHAATVSALTPTPGDADTNNVVAAWVAARAGSLAGVELLRDEILSAHNTPDLAGLTVLISRLETLPATPRPLSG